MSKLNNTENVKIKYNKVHGEGTYDYSKVVYTGVHNKVKVICHTHGEFEISSNSHARGSGCKKCGTARTAEIVLSKVGLILGHGVSSNGKYARSYVDSMGNRVATEEYRRWFNMLHRCYSENYAEKRPSYAGCIVSEEFKDFQFFAEWCNSQIGFHMQGWHLDKDLLSEKGCKMYSTNNCVFLPQNLNVLLTKREAKRGKHPIGVSYHKDVKMFLSNCNDGDGNSEYLGQFDNSLDAFLAYKKRKEYLIKTLANQYKDVIDPRAYEALMKYEVHIDD